MYKWVVATAVATAVDKAIFSENEAIHFNYVIIC